MGNFRPGGRGFGKKDFGGKGGFSRGPKRQMFDAVCSSCGNDCQIPFRPVDGRPVFCSNCFDKQNPTAPHKFGGNSFKRLDRGSKQMHKAVCATCGNTCEVPFRPMEGKPVYCSSCFGKSDVGMRTKSVEQSGDQFAKLNAKLDKILSLLSASAPTVVSKDKKEKKESKKVAEEKKADEKPIKSKAKAKSTVKKAAKKKKK